MSPAIGSSPHTRGALADRVGGHQAGRIIPAYAGSTLAAHVFWLCRKDHPRIRGEHLAGLGRVIGGVGSSPHTRGAHQNQCDSRHEAGIIPAYAGSTYN